MEKREKKHISVLKREVIEGLKIEKDGKYIDCTFGQGGHSAEILKVLGKEGRVLGIELSPELFAMGKKSFTNERRLILVNSNFKDLLQIARKNNFLQVDGILFDLGICSWQIEQKLGFAFSREDQFLDMRYNPCVQKITAAQILNDFLPKELEKIFKRYGQIRQAKKIVEEILRQRPIFTTDRLKKLILPFAQNERNLIRKVFLSLRIAVNDELGNLRDALNQTIFLLKNEKRLLVICYHSLEERIVKYFARQNKKYLKVVNKKPILPSKKEIEENRRARSAKLYILEKK